MSIKPSTNEPGQADEIRRQMAEIRRDLDAGIEEVVQSTRVMTDWRHYVRAYPWICVAGAVALGFLVVPRRASARSSCEPPAGSAPYDPALATAAVQRQTRGTWASAALTLMANALARAAVSYIGHYGGQTLRRAGHNPSNDGQDNDKDQSCL